MKLCHLRPHPATAAMSQEGTNADKDIICTLLEYLHFLLLYKFSALKLETILCPGYSARIRC